MINITFPDGSVRPYEQGITGLQIAESISPALARSVVSCGVNGETVELNRPINADAKIALYKFEDEEGKHSFWHTSAHLLAEALKELYPGIQFGFGPAIEAGFFYDVLLPNGEQIKEGDFANRPISASTSSRISRTAQSPHILRATSPTSVRVHTSFLQVLSRLLSSHQSLVLSGVAMQSVSRCSVSTVSLSLRRRCLTTTS